MKNRLLSSVVLWAIILGLSFAAGDVGIQILIFIAAFPSLWEALHLFEKGGYRPDTAGALLALAAVLGLAAIFPQERLPSILLWASAFPAITVFILLRCPPGQFMERLSSTMAAFILLALPSYLALLLVQQQEAILILWIIAVTKFGDVGALLTGMVLGRHKMAPRLSPNKTWEGLAGGLLTSVLLSVAFAKGTFTGWPSTFTATEAAIAGLIISASGVLGDLMESALKREAAVKDSGSTFPGLGGFMDIADSLLLAIPVGYVVLWFFIS
jgi:phosphatidate cytidylyltransferase